MRPNPRPPKRVVQFSSVQFSSVQFRSVPLRKNKRNKNTEHGSTYNTNAAIRAYVRMVGAITTTKLRVPADIWDVDKCLTWSDEEAEQATVRLDIHTDGQRIRRLLWIPSEGVHTARESAKATVTCTEFVNQKRCSLTLQQLTQQPESNTLSRKRGQRTRK